MGGNYKHPEAPNLPAAMRIPAVIYDEIKERISELSYSGVAIPHSVLEKQDHGDIDVLVASYLMPTMRECLAKIAWVDPSTGRSYLEQLSHPESQDSYICTFKFQDSEYHVQVDLIPTALEDFNFSFGYFSWNDLGNLIGRIAHRRGLKFGHDGLWYIHRRGDRVLGEFCLTKSFADAIEYLGFDHHLWAQGFETFEEMFQYVKNSKYFEECAYPLEHQNHRARVRDAKRKTYNAFLEWLNYSGDYVPSEKEKHIANMRKDFPEIDRKIIESEKQDDLRMAYKEKVNGNIVSELTGETGKDLGALMNYVKAIFPCDEKILKYPDDSIYCGILFAYSLWKNEVEVASSK